MGIDGFIEANDPKSADMGPEALTPDELEAQKASLRERFPDIKV